MDYDDDISPARVWMWFWIIFGTIVVISISAWIFSVATAGVKGAGDVHKQNENSNNRIAAENQFNQLWGNIKGYHDDIKNTAAAVKANPADGFQASVLASDQKACRSAVQEYNADTNDMTLKDWRPSADPVSIDSQVECEIAS